jgi:hypothetical protein
VISWFQAFTFTWNLCRYSAGGGGNKSVGVHMTLSATPRAMPASASNQVSAAGGRAGVFEPLRAGESNRLAGLLEDMVGLYKLTHSLNAPDFNPYM